MSDSKTVAAKLWWIGIQWNAPQEIVEILEIYSWLPMVVVSIQENVVEFQWSDEENTVCSSEYVYLDIHWKKHDSTKLSEPLLFQCSTALLVAHFKEFADRPLLWSHFDGATSVVCTRASDASEENLARLHCNAFCHCKSKPDKRHGEDCMFPSELFIVHDHSHQKMWSSKLVIESPKTFFHMVSNLVLVKFHVQVRPIYQEGTKTWWLFIQNIPPWPEIQYLVPIKFLDRVLESSLQLHQQNRENDPVFQLLFHKNKRELKNILEKPIIKERNHQGHVMHSFFSNIFGSKIFCEPSAIPFALSKTKGGKQKKSALSRKQSTNAKEQRWINMSKNNARTKNHEQTWNSNAPWITGQIATSEQQPQQQQQHTKNENVLPATAGYQSMLLISMEWLNEKTWDRHHFNVEDVMSMLTNARHFQLQQMLLLEGITIPLGYPKTSSEPVINYAARTVLINHLMRIYSARYQSWNSRQSVTQTRLHMEDPFCTQHGPNLPIHPISNTDFKTLFITAKADAALSEPFVSWQDAQAVHQLESRYPYISKLCCCSAIKVRPISQLYEWRDIYVLPIKSNPAKTILLLQRVLILPESCSIASIPLQRMISQSTRFMLVPKPATDKSKKLDLCMDTDELFYVYGREPILSTSPNPTISTVAAAIVDRELSVKSNSSTEYVPTPAKRSRKSLKK